MGRDNGFLVGLGFGVLLAIIVLLYMDWATVDLERCVKDGSVTICHPYRGKVPDVPMPGGGFVRVRR